MPPYKRLAVAALTSLSLAWSPLLLSLKSPWEQAASHSWAQAPKAKLLKTEQSSASSQPAQPRFEPYQAEPINLWWFEARRFVRGKPLVAPNRQGMVYSEVTFLPHSQQTFSQLFWLPLNANSSGGSFNSEAEVNGSANSPSQASLADESLTPFLAGPDADPPPDPLWKQRWQRVLSTITKPFKTLSAWLTRPFKAKKPRASATDGTEELLPLSGPNKAAGPSWQQAKVLYSVGQQLSQRYRFNVLEPLAFSADSQQLLAVLKTGQLHGGLQVNEVLLFQQDAFTSNPVSNQPTQLYRALLAPVREQRGSTERYGMQGDPNAVEQQWQVKPLGWSSLQADTVLYEVWAYQTKQPPKFLGLWQLNVKTRGTALVSETQLKTPPLQQSGWQWASQAVKPS